MDVPSEYCAMKLQNWMEVAALKPFMGSKKKLLRHSIARKRASTYDGKKRVVSDDRKSNCQTIVMIDVNIGTVWLQLVDIFLNVRGSV